MAATLNDIAKETGLSIATISKYINGIKIKAENEKKIKAAIIKLDYTVNEYARGLKSNKSKTIGVIIPELSNTFITHIITKIEEILRANGYSAIICDCHSEEDLECDAVRFLISKMVDGIINMPICMDGKHLKPAIEKNIPVVLIDRQIPNLKDNTDRVFIDNVSAAFNATNHLIENGHKKIGLIVGPHNVFTSDLRLSGYEKSLTENKLVFRERLVIHSDYTVQGGYEALRELMSKNEDMTAVFITNYEMTLGAIIYANEQGISIPQRLSFIGFDNMELSQVINPKLTTVSQPLEEIGEKSAKIMLSRLVENYSGIAIKEVLSSQLIEGASVKNLV